MNGERQPTGTVVPLWRNVLEGALHHNWFGHDRSLEARICGTLIGLHGQPDFQSFVGAARHAYKLGWASQKSPDYKIASHRLVMQVWELIAGRNRGSRLHHSLYITWRADYDTALAAFREEQCAVGLSDSTQRGKIVVTLHVLARLKNGRAITINDVRQINRNWGKTASDREVWFTVNDFVNSLKRS